MSRPIKYPVGTLFRFSKAIKTLPNTPVDSLWIVCERYSYSRRKAIKPFYPIILTEFPNKYHMWYVDNKFLEDHFKKVSKNSLIYQLFKVDA